MMPVAAKASSALFRSCAPRQSLAELEDRLLGFQVVEGVIGSSASATSRSNP